MSRATNLAPLFFPPPSDEVSFRQGQVLAFDLSTGENSIDVGGATLVNVPLLNVTDSVSLTEGTIVGLLKWKSSWWIIGRVILPNSPGYGQLCAFEENGEGVCLTQNGIDFYPPQPPDSPGRIFAQHFFDGDGRMWLEMIPPREKGGTGDNRFLIEGGITDGTDGSFFLKTLGNGHIESGGALDMLSVSGSATMTSGTGSDAFVRGKQSTWIDAQDGDGQYLATGNIFVNAGQQVQLISGENSVFIEHETTSNAANCFIRDDGLIRRSTSARRFKQDIEDVSVNPREVISLRPRTWRDRKEVAADPDTDRWHVGFIAEEVEEAGLGLFVNYDEDGKPGSIAYDRLSVALLELLKYQDKRLTDVEARLSALDGKIQNIETEPTTVKPKRTDSTTSPTRMKREDY